jgi:hypothetical protein
LVASGLLIHTASGSARGPDSAGAAEVHVGRVCRPISWPGCGWTVCAGGCGSALRGGMCPTLRALAVRLCPVPAGVYKIGKSSARPRCAPQSRSRARRGSHTRNTYLSTHYAHIRGRRGLPKAIGTRHDLVTKCLPARRGRRGPDGSCRSLPVLGACRWRDRGKAGHK